jgi:hypothetical protein
MDAIKELKKMKLIPELDMPGIEALKAGIPRKDIYEEITGKKPMEKVPPTIIPRFGGGPTTTTSRLCLIDFIRR